jgi:creatinine amidohydrolase
MSWNFRNQPLAELQRMTYDEVQAYIERGDAMVVWPIGATEEHGPHAPLGTDTFAAEVVAREVCIRLGAVLAPALPYGMSLEEGHYPGTIGLTPSLLGAVVREVCSKLVADGFNLILVLSGHRGNDHAVLAGLQEIGADSSAHLLYMCYQDANRGHVKQLLSGTDIPVSDVDDRHGADGHGGSIELSLALAHSPDSVRMHKRRVPDRILADVRRSFPFHPILAVEEVAPEGGYFGDPSFCDAQLGHDIAAATAERIASEVRRYLSHFPRRRSRKESPEV